MHAQKRSKQHGAEANTFVVLGYDNTVESSTTEFETATRVPELVFADMRRFGIASQGSAEIYFADSLLGLMGDLEGRLEPLPPFVMRLLEKYSAVHFMNGTAIRFYNRHKLPIIGTVEGKISRAQLPKGLGTLLTIPVCGA